MELKIEKGIAIPSQGRGKYKRLADEMEVGDFHFICKTFIFSSPL